MELISRTSQQWTQGNPVLPQGQKGVESDTGKFKIGDGFSAWTPLNYAGSSGVSIGQRHFLGCYGTNHQIAPGSYWDIVWNTDDAWTPEQAWPGVLNTSNLNALPSGVYVFDFSTSLDAPMPKDAEVYLSVVAELENPPHYNLGSGKFFHSSDNAALNAFTEIAGTLLVPENCTALKFTIAVDHALGSDSADTNPYVLASASLSLTKIS